MKTISETFARYAQQQQAGYVGTIGFDFIKVTEGPKKGKIFLLECNPRQTASTYPLAISAQMRGRYTDRVEMKQDEKKGMVREVIRTNWGITMKNGVPTRCRNFREMKQTLFDAGLLFRERSGIIPFNIRLMDLPEPRCGIISVGETIEHSEQMLKDTERRLAA